MRAVSVSKFRPKRSTLQPHLLEPSNLTTAQVAPPSWHGKTYFQIVRTDPQFLPQLYLSLYTNEHAPIDGAHDRTGEEAFRRGITVQYRPSLAKDSGRSTRRSGTCTSSWTRINQRAGAFEDARRVWDKFGERQYQYHL
jgi:hypothetical protein